MKRITVPEEGIETLFGSYDENLKHFESLFNVRIRTHGHDLLVEGESPNLDKVDRMVDQLSSLVRDGYKLSNADVKTASALMAENGAVDLRDHFLKGSVATAGKRRVALMSSAFMSDADGLSTCSSSFRYCRNTAAAPATAGAAMLVPCK